MSNIYALGYIPSNRGIKTNVVGFTADTVRRVAQTKIIIANSYRRIDNGVVFMNKMR
jgi:hypothetical protein